MTRTPAMASLFSRALGLHAARSSLTCARLPSVFGNSQPSAAYRAVLSPPPQVELRPPDAKWMVYIPPCADDLPGGVFFRIASQPNSYGSLERASGQVGRTENNNLPVYAIRAQYFFTLSSP